MKKLSDDPFKMAMIDFLAATIKIPFDLPWIMALERNKPKLYLVSNKINWI